MVTRTFAAIAAASMIATAAAASAQAPDRVAAADLKWQEMFPGVEFAPAYGDWEKGAHGKYVRFAPGSQAPMHTHSGPYHAVMISGRLANLYAEGRSEVGPGDYWFVAARRPHGHDCVSAEPCFFYTHSDAFWDIELAD
jgi:quercetin dioxygenase-like cupin family protein